MQKVVEKNSPRTSMDALLLRVEQLERAAQSQATIPSAPPPDPLFARSSPITPPPPLSLTTNLPIPQTQKQNQKQLPISHPPIHPTTYHTISSTSTLPDAVKKEIGE